MIFRQLVKNPKRLFLLDGLGAIFSAILLGIVFSNFNELIGMPERTLYFLAFFPCIFAIYDFNCYFRINKYDQYQFRIIAYSNLIYCFISLGLLFQYRNDVTDLGWIYFIFEILIIGVLIIYEFKMDKNILVEK